MKKRHICISVVTRGRPKMLCDLFSSLAVMHRPQDALITFLIIENTDKPTLDAVIEDFRTMMPTEDIVYRTESTLGISAVRNHALNFAADGAFDYLVYVDDDELVEPDWLVKLLAERDRHDLDIVGSPVRPKPYEQNLTFMQKIVWTGIQCSERKSEKKCKRKCDRGQADSIKVATGSWMGKLDFFRSTGLRFDARLGLTGGEDWNLWAQAKAMGAQTGWAPDAIVYESVPSSRLTLTYHFRRNRDHNITEFGARYRENASKTLKQLPVKVAGRFLKLLVTVCSIPFRGSQGIVSAATALGGFIGLLQGCLGQSSYHYTETTGC